VDGGWSCPGDRAEAATGKVLTLAWMNRESLALTAKTSEAHYWSRSRGTCGKGEQSGHVQKVEIRDCDNDAILLLIEQSEHRVPTGAERCFFQRLDAGRWWTSNRCSRIRRQSTAMADTRSSDDDALDRVAATIAARRDGDPATSYVARCSRKATTPS